jgi:type IX secretion system PorP/SprF family membrane protein
MKRITNWILTLALVAIAWIGYGQQQGQYSQYMMNYFLINPGVAGAEDFIDIRAGYRMQWAGLQGAPRNYYLSGHMPLNKVHNKMSRGQYTNAHHTMGAIFSGQTLGLLTHNTAYLSYAYHLPLSKKAVLSMGAIAGMNQFSVDQNKANWGDNNYDGSIAGMKKTNFDAGVGLWFYTKKVFIGLSSMQIAQNKVDFGTTVQGSGILNRHFYLTGGYKIKIDDYWTVIPSVLFKGSTAAYQVDINTKVRYRDLFWAGASYRRTDAIAFLTGVSIPLSNIRPNQKHGNNSRLEIGYSYDLTTSKLNGFSYGTHEIMIGVLLPTKGRMYCPSDFW